MYGADVIAPGLLLEIWWISVVVTMVASSVDVHQRPASSAVMRPSANHIVQRNVDIGVRRLHTPNERSDPRRHSYHKPASYHRQISFHPRRTKFRLEIPYSEACRLWKCRAKSRYFISGGRTHFSDEIREFCDGELATKHPDRRSSLWPIINCRMGLAAAVVDGGWSAADEVLLSHNLRSRRIYCI